MGGGATIAETNQRVEIFFPYTSVMPSAGYTSKCTMSGDYDVQVDYQLLVWPPQNGVRVGLAATPGGITERVSYGANDPSGPSEVYLRDFGAGPFGTTGTGDTSGKLRLVRTGSTLTPYYYSSAWVALPSGATSTAPAVIALNVWSDDSHFTGHDVRVAFDNFIVNAGTVSCPAPVCTAAPATESSVLGINGTVTAGASGIGTVALVGGSSNLSLTVPPFTPGASSATFRAVQINSAQDAQGTVLATDQVGSTCTVPLSFRVRASGPASNETICATNTGEGYAFKVSSALSQPAGTSACSAHLATSNDALPSSYFFASASRILVIRSPISGTNTQMELTQDGTFDSRLRLMFSRSADGGASFSSLTDVTTSVTPGSTIIRGTGQWSDVKAVAAVQQFDAVPPVPALGEWGMIVMSLLLSAASSVLLMRRRPALAASGPREHYTPPWFVLRVFVRALAGTRAIGLVGLATGLFLGWVPSPTDVVGSLLSAGILAYLAHLWGVLAKGSSSAHKGDN